MLTLRCHIYSGSNARREYGTRLNINNGVIGMVMVKLGRCPRCGGNMFLDTDPDGWYEECLQCSYSHGLGDAQPKPGVASAPEHEEPELGVVGAKEYGDRRW